MRPIILSLLLIIAASLSISAQDTYYVRFTDKNNNSYPVSRPEAFLSPRSIERRRAQQIPVTETDLPLTDSYVNALAPLADRIVYRLKWDNAIIFKSSDTSFAAKARQFPFVRSVTKISGQGPSAIQKKLSPISQKNLSSSTLDTGFYGVSQNQNAMINVNALHQMGYWGDNVLIAVMDAGFVNVSSNPYFTQTYAQGRVLYTWNYVYDTSDVYGYDSHGAETFSCIAANIPHQMVGTAPNAQFLLFVTEDVRSEKIIEEYNWAHAAEVADSIGADVFSTSLGYTTFDPIDSMYNTTYASLNGDSTPIAKAANLAARRGILVINSAGNYGNDSWHYPDTPGDADSGVSVGAVDAQGTISGSSSWGPNSAGVLKPNLCAQGVNASVVLTDAIPGYSSGTSFSCPITAGAFACLRGAFPSVPNMAMIAAVQRTGTYAANPNDHYGYGIPDFGLAYRYLRLQYPGDTMAAPQALIYPNPFATSFNILISGLLNAPVNVDIYDLLGQKVWTGSYPIGTYTDNIIQVAPPYLGTGSYILRINNTYTTRIVKGF
jgi:serine protease AprX